VDNLTGKMTASQIADIIRKGSGRMPAFVRLGRRANLCVSGLPVGQRRSSGDRTASGSRGAGGGVEVHDGRATRSSSIPMGIRP
jgi:hypothetical protein